MKKSLILTMILLLISAYNWGQTIIITESGGWIESAYVKWQPVDSAESYNVYYSGEGITDQKIDDQLIRDYDSYFRADILGLSTGSYTIVVKPVFSGSEYEGSVTGTLTVEAQDRTGFAFSNGRIPGAYKSDGTIKDGVVILYITENSKNKISLEVTGANVNPCIGLQTILEGFKKGDDNRPLIVRMVGQITDLDYMDKGDIVIENENNVSGYITFEGVGDDAVADGWGIRVKNASNIEIRNIGFMNCNSNEGDNLGLQQDNDYIWIHHCDFFYGDAGSDADQAKGDGALDSKRSGYVTISYNHFWDTGKSNLLGNGTEDPEYLTYHHNWYDHSDSRHPRVRSHSVHVYNNYYDGISKYGIGSTLGSSVFVEANYFRNCKYPMLISMQGSDVFDEESGSNDYSNMPTFSSEDGGIIKAFNNYMTGQKRFVAYGDTDYPNPTVDFDAYVVSTRDETVSGSVVSAYGDNAYNNFDTDGSVMYSYSAESPENAKNKVITYSGRMNGGDFDWTFNNETDDASYAVNTDLKTALTSYTTSLIAVQNDTASGSSGSGGSGGVIDGDEIHNFTLSGLSSTFYSITGNLSDSKGTVIYDELTLTQCLKMESATNVSFTAAEEANLTLVFNEGFTGTVKVDDVNYNASAGILSITLTAGPHTIKKGETANLYFMSVKYPTQINILKSSSISLYPNPVIDVVNINSEIEIDRIDIYNLTGILVHKSFNIQNTININNLNSGNYLAIIYTEYGITKKMIVKK